MTPFMVPFHPGIVPTAMGAFHFASGFGHGA